MEQGSWESDSRSASQEFSPLWNRKIGYRAYNNISTLDPAPNQMDSVHIVTSCFFTF
jgi:hypothetical protein